MQSFGLMLNKHRDYFPACASEQSDNVKKSFFEDQLCKTRGWFFTGDSATCWSCEVRATRRCTDLCLFEELFQSI